MGCGLVKSQSSDKVMYLSPINQSSDKLLTEDECYAIESTWNKIVLVQRSDLFHKTFMKSIRKSPKMNEIMALGEYCVRDLSKWPKLNTIANQVLQFMQNLIFKLEFDKHRCSKEAQALGRRHTAYAKFGFQPHLLDIWAQSLVEVIDTLKIEDNDLKSKLTAAWQTFILKITENMNIGYAQERKRNAKNIRTLGGSNNGHQVHTPPLD